MHPSSVIKGNAETREVTIDGIPLSPKKSQEVFNHSPDGFSWGYRGSGPAQLALALLMEITDGEEANGYHHDFKWDIIAPLPPEDFTMNAKIIYDWWYLR